MLITRCPNCETTFRVRMEQLNLRGGRVRCGHCHVPFSALASMEELPEDTATSLIGTPPQAIAQRPTEPTFAPPVYTPTPEPVFNPPQNAEPDPIAAIDLPPTPLALHRTEHDSTKTDPLPHTVSLADEDEGDDADQGFDLEFDIDDEARAPAVIGKADVPSKSPADNSGQPGDQFIELGSASDDAEAEAFDREFQKNLGASAEPDEAFIDDDDDNEGDDVPQLHTVFLDEDIPQGIGAEQAALAKSQARRTLWLGNLLLLITGTLLATYVMRVELTRLYPVLRAPLEQACQHLSCDIPYPRDADEVLLVGSDLTQAATNTAGGYHLAVTVRNHAHYPVAWPQLEITLTDRFERALTRRVLEPAEWLPANLAQRPAFEAQGELTSQITLSSDAQVMGYRLGVFYR